jgi:hypothetical protein
MEGRTFPGNKIDEYGGTIYNEGSMPVSCATFTSDLEPYGAAIFRFLARIGWRPLHRGRRARWAHHGDRQHGRLRRGRRLQRRNGDAVQLHGVRQPARHLLRRTGLLASAAAEPAMGPNGQVAGLGPKAFVADSDGRVLP